MCLSKATPVGTANTAHFSKRYLPTLSAPGAGVGRRTTYLKQLQWAFEAEGGDGGGGDDILCTTAATGLLTFSQILEV